MERRYYQRTQIDLDSVFLLSNTDIFPREFNGVIEDISEGGVKIVVDPLTSSSITDSININDCIHFDGLDDYTLFGVNHSTILNGDVKVVRKESSPEKIVLGCILTPLTKELASYVKDKQTSLFISSLK